MLTDDEIRASQGFETASKEMERILKEEKAKDGGKATERELRAKFELMFTGIHELESKEPALAEEARMIVREALSVAAEMILRIEDLNIFRKILAEIILAAERTSKNPPQKH